MKRETIHTLIVDDEPAARGALRLLLAEDSEIEIVGEAADGVSAVRRIEKDAPDLVFLDIQMPGLDGFSVLQQLEAPELLVVVFVTAYDQHALKAFEVHAVDYLLKPFNDERFHLALSRAKREVRQRRLGTASDRLVALLEDLGRQKSAPAVTPQRYLGRLAIKSGGRVTLLSVRDLDWIEAEGDYVRLHAGKANHLLRETMKRLEAQLDPTRFVRIHRSHIINVERIRELQPYFRGEYVVVLHDGTNLKLARSYKPHLEAVLGREF